MKRIAERTDFNRTEAPALSDQPAPSAGKSERVWLTPDKTPTALLQARRYQSRMAGECGPSPDRKHDREMENEARSYRIQPGIPFILASEKELASLMAVCLQMLDFSFRLPDATGILCPEISAAAEPGASCPVLPWSPLQPRRVDQCCFPGSLSGTPIPAVGT